MVERICIHCSVALVVIAVDAEHKRVTLKCPVCGYVVLVQLDEPASGYVEAYYIRQLQQYRV